MFAGTHMLHFRFNFFAGLGAIAPATRFLFAGVFLAARLAATGAGSRAAGTFLGTGFLLRPFFCCHKKFSLPCET